MSQEEIVFDVVRNGQLIKVVLNLKKEPKAGGKAKIQPASI
jgi:hypothetical protein